MALKKSDLERALERDELVPHFQPYFEMKTGRVVGFEALIRWQHPSGELILPDRFIPLAERSGLITPLTRNLLRHVMAAAVELPDHLHFSVNVSPLQLRDDTLPQMFEAAASAAQYPLQRMTVEITESALIDNLDRAASIAADLKSLGLLLAVDDFGTGYSSLKHLQALPFDVIKVDQSFVRCMVERRESRKIVSAVLGLGQTLGLRTVAEGVETPDQERMLQWLGCDVGQGWLFGRPMPAAHLGVFLERMELTPPVMSGSGALSTDEEFRLDNSASRRLAHLQALYDAAPVGLCFLDREMRFTSVNKRLAQMMGTSAISFVGRNIDEAMPRIAAEMKPSIQRALDGECISDLEVPLSRVCTPEEAGTALVSFQPARDEANEVVGVSLSFIDITERRLAQNALRESEDHYRHTVELNPQVNWTCDAAGNLMTANHRWQELTGLTPEQSMGHGWLTAVHPEDLPRIQPLWLHSVATGAPVDIQYRQYRIRTPHGKFKWVRGRGAPRRDEQGRIIRWYGVVEDIDDLKRAEELLQQSQASLLAVFHAVPVGIVTATAPEGRVLLANARAELLLGHPILHPDEPAAGACWHALSEEGQPLDWGTLPLMRAMREARMVRFEKLDYRQADGTRVSLCLTAAPIFSRHSDVLGSVMTIMEAGPICCVDSPPPAAFSTLKTPAGGSTSAARRAMAPRTPRIS
ncbi:MULTISPECIES: EAL domain-containing protein [Acidobacterium]|uniref:Sensory box/GGDEF family protein n=1 Tax=Acidobacterium capsulatum (strain ATCC 51196 / DSM 11244 / BCRC 80197 / JCM 7670 / NBRC 15755 / NCIMB 13165 / 161) TaxID=240015 RepID=C1F918_ACIC5|nr:MULTISPECIES: EAL domain-containing protein [Acidobacterium]ACO31374.1 sensory box/GGDEF family protein [Acidobacterium capsulatum ATCC 51196]HCT62141.1 PAS domain S-box protein [Acidobacterium sp.]